MPFRKRRRSRNPLVIALSLLVLGLGALAVVPGLLIAPDALRDRVAAEVKALTGQELRVKGEVSFSAFPSPGLTLMNVEIAPPTEAARPGPRLRAESMTLQLAPLSLFSTPEIRSLALNNPVLEIERAADGGVQWGWLGLPAGGNSRIQVSVRGGKVVYFNPATEKTLRFEHITLDFSDSPEAGIQASGAFHYLDKPVNLLVAIPPLAVGAAHSRIEMKFWQSQATVLSAMLERATGAGGQPAWRGDMTLQAEDVNSWLPDSPTTTAPTLDAAGAATSAPTNQKAPYPLKLTGAVEYAGNQLVFSNLALDTADSSGKGNAALVLSDTPAMAVRMDFSRLKLNPAALSHFMSGGVSLPSESPIATAEAASRLPKTLALDVDVSAESVFLGAQQFSGARLAGALKEGALVINNISARYAGDSVITLSGNVVDTARGLRFQGRTETSGKDLRALLSGFDPAAARLPEKGFKEFYLVSNLFLSPEQLRLSESELRLGELSLQGGMVTYFEAQPRVEAEIALNDVDMDYFRNAWREELAQGKPSEYTFNLTESSDFGWLRGLHPLVDLKVSFDRFTFLEKTGKQASFRIYARAGEVGLKAIDMQYPAGSLKGDISLNVNGAQPALSVALEMPELDMAYFSANPTQALGALVKPENPDARWSREVFDFGWMSGYSANIKLAVGRLTHQGSAYDRVALESTLVNDALQIKSLTFDRFGGNFSVTGQLSGGKVPGLSITYTGYNAEVKPLLQTVSSTNNLSGRVSLSGSVVTSGVSFEDWLRQAEAKIAIAARGLRVQNFNLQGVVDGVAAARAVADVEKNVARALPASSTEFSVDGNLNISAGVVRTPGLALQCPVAGGVLTGELRILPWRMALNSVFQMKSLSSETVPTFTVDASGTPDAYETRLDTTSLEAYVAKRIISR